MGKYVWGKSGSLADRKRQRVTIQYDANQGKGAGDAYNQPVPNWQTLATVYAEVLETAGGETELSEQVVSDATHVVKIRYRAGLDTSMQMLWGSRTLQMVRIRRKNKSI